MRDKRQLLGKHIASLKIWNDQHLSTTGHGRSQMLCLGRTHINRIVHCQRTIDETTVNLPTVRHFGQNRSIHRRRDTCIDGLDG